VVGWTDPEGSHPWLGALLVAYYDPDGRLVYAGRGASELRAVPGDIPPSANADRTAQASTRSGTISLPLVSGPRKRARHQLPPPIMQPTSIGIENPSW